MHEDAVRLQNYAVSFEEVACCISSAFQHICGIKDSGKIIAVNTDRKAPVFLSADIGIVASAQDTLALAIEALREK
ncbi:MAG: hypothetical protein AB9917_05585 [Negativicutes bacterium]